MKKQYLTNGKRIKDAPWVGSWRNAKVRCSQNGQYFKKGIKFLLTPDDMECLWIRDNGASLNNPSIDRIDNKGHYSLSNCQFIEVSVNSSKDLIGKKATNARRIGVHNALLRERGKPISSKVVRRMMKQGLTIFGIAKKLNVDYTTIRARVWNDIIVVNGVPRLNPVSALTEVKKEIA